MTTVLGRDDEGRLTDVVIASNGGAPHSHNEYATDADLTTHAATPHGGEAGPHTHDEYATDADLTTHAGTAHGTQAHAISGASHTGTLDHSALGSVTANQHHNQAHSISGADHTGTLNHSALGSVSADQHHAESHAARHASGQADALTAANIGAASSGHNHDAAYEPSGAVSTHAATSHGVTAHADLTGVSADQHHARQHSITSASDHTFPGGSTFLRADGTFASPPGGSEAFPVGSVFIAVVSTDPATLLGYGTWSAFGAGRVLVGLDAGQTEFDTVEETGGAKTHTLTAAEIPAHTHIVTSQTATTGSATSYEHGTLDTSSAEAEATEVTGSTGGGGAHNNLQPYIVVFMWKRTA